MANELENILNGLGIAPSQPGVGDIEPPELGGQVTARLVPLLSGDPIQDFMSDRERRRAEIEAARADEVKRITETLSKYKRTPGGVGVSKFSKLRRGEKAAAIAMALADIGAGAFGGESRSLQGTAERNRAMSEKFVQQNREIDMGIEQLESKNRMATIQEREADAELGLKLRLEQTEKNKMWAKDIIQASDVLTLAERFDALTGDDRQKAQTVVSQVNPNLDPQSAELAAGAVLGKVQEGRQLRSQKVMQMKQDYVKRISDDLKNPYVGQPLQANLPNVKEIVARINGAQTMKEVQEVGSEWEAKVAEAMRKMAKSGGSGDPVLKAQLLEQRALIAEARKYGVDFNAFDPAFYGLGGKIKNVLDTSKDGLLHEDANFWLQNQVSRMKSADPKTMATNVRAVKVWAEKSLKEVKARVAAAKKEGKTAQDVIDELKASIYSDYGLVGKWAAEAERHFDPLYKRILQEYGVDKDVPDPTDRSLSPREPGFIEKVKTFGESLIYAPGEKEEMEARRANREIKGE